MLLVVIFAALAGFCFANHAAAYQPGDKVVVIADTKLSVKGNPDVDDVWPGLVLKVQDVNGLWLWLSNGKPGWLNQKHVIPLNRAAVDRLTSLIKANPRNAELYSGRASVWMHLEEIDIAIADLSEAIRLNPTAAYYSNRGVAWRRKGEVDKAISDYAEALRLDPKDAGTFLNRGTARRAKGEQEKAMADFSEALRLDPKHAVANNNRGTSWHDKGAYNKAIADYSEALRLDPKYAAAYANRGLAWHMKGEHGKATVDYKEALRFDPQLVGAYTGLAWLQANSSSSRYRDTSAAIANAKKACELTAWNDAYAISVLAEAYAERGDHATAVKWQQKAINLAPPEWESDFRKRLELYRVGKS